MYRGAEAIVKKTKIIGIPAVLKDRMTKTYRVSELDCSLRKTRTRAEARLLHKAKLAGVLCPTVLQVDDFSIGMSLIKGRRPKMNTTISKSAGGLLAKLHASDIIHGDFTPANLLIGHGQWVMGGGQNKKTQGSKLTAQGNLHVIDFGLGFFSNDIEDKAVDVYTILKAMGDEKAKTAFLLGYHRYAKAKQVMKRLKDIESRVRYAF